MNYQKNSVGLRAKWAAGLGICAILLAGSITVRAQAPAGPPPGGAPGQPGPGGRRPAPPPKNFPVTLNVADGTSASYRVREQLAGINFPSDAVGTSTAVTGSIYLKADGSVDSSKSKLNFDLKSLKSDQEMRDGYIQGRTLETDKYPTAEFVPKSITGVPNPLTGQVGFQMAGDMTVHGKTAPVTWQGIATIDNNSYTIAGRATTQFPFATFGMAKPTLARLLSVDDNINLEVAFKFKIE